MGGVFFSFVVRYSCVRGMVMWHEGIGNVCYSSGMVVCL